MIPFKQTRTLEYKKYISLSQETLYSLSAAAYILTSNRSLGQGVCTPSNIILSPAFYINSTYSSRLLVTLQSALSTSNPFPQWFYLRITTPPGFRLFFAFSRNSTASLSGRQQSTHCTHTQSYFSVNYRSCNPLLMKCLTFFDPLRCYLAAQTYLLHWSFRSTVWQIFASSCFVILPIPAPQSSTLLRWVWGLFSKSLSMNLREYIISGWLSLPQPPNTPSQVASELVQYQLPFSNQVLRSPILLTKGAYVSAFSSSVDQNQCMDLQRDPWLSLPSYWLVEVVLLLLLLLVCMCCLRFLSTGASVFRYLLINCSVQNVTDPVIPITEKVFFRLSDTSKKVSKQQKRSEF